MSQHTRSALRRGLPVTAPRLLAAAGVCVGLLAAPLSLRAEDQQPSTEPTSSEPASTEPASTEPASTETAPTEPASTEPVSTEPASTEATTTEPAPAVPGSADPASAEAAAAAVAVPPAPPPLDERGRRIMKDEPTVLAFRNVSLDQVVPFIVESTGKVVLPQPDVLTKKITIINDQPIARERALDLVFLALQQVDVAVVETADLIILRNINEIDRQDVPVLGPEISVLDRSDLGTIVEKVFQLQNGSAANLGEILKGIVPQFAKLNIDADSNQIVVMGNIGLLQRMERLITALDQPNSASLVTETFHLRYADATNVATNIRDLFGQSTTQGNNNRNPAADIARAFAERSGGGGGGNSRNNRTGGASTAATSQNLRVTANTQQNSVTILAERTVLDQVREQIVKFWDQPLPDEAVVPRIYDLKNSDPVKVKDLLTGLFGRAAGTTGGGGANQNQAGAGRLAGQFSFEAIPEKSQLVVVGKSPDNLAVIDKIIAEVDRPQTAGLPRIIELKHASAEELAEQLNALLSQEGTLASIPRQETGLTESSASVSPFATDQASTATTNQNNTAASAGNIQFWWQRARPPTTTAGSSNLVSKIRIVPVWRQNALMILSPPEYQESMVSLITNLDRPGRQVLLSAVIAEISLDDLDALGLRWSSQGITPTNADNSVSVGAGTGQNQETFSGQKNNLLPGLFDTSVLDIGVNLNLVLQALNQKTKVNILSEPRIFTSDNQEAEFFSGQDVPFIDQSQTTDNGALTQTFDYRAVGIQLRARPRITVTKDVDLRINLELSSIQANQTLFGGFIVDRRETTTHLIVRDGQTVVVSGILRSEDSDLKRKVPVLGDIPLIGGLFTSTEKTKSRTELIAFITPTVIENPEEASSKTPVDQERLNELRRRLDPESVNGESSARLGGPAQPSSEPAAESSSESVPQP